MFEKILNKIHLNLIKNHIFVLTELTNQKLDDGEFAKLIKNTKLFRFILIQYILLQEKLLLNYTKIKLNLISYIHCFSLYINKFIFN